MRNALAAAAAAAVFAAVSATAHAAVPAYIEKAVADPSRPADDRAADALRKPGEVLAFSGVKPGMKVGEFLPGGGYYTRMLSDAVGPKGHVFALETTRWGQEPIEADKKAIAKLTNVSLDTAGFGDFHLPEKVDLFWTTLNYHDLHVKKYGDVNMAAFNKHVFDSLKPHGVYLIIDHEAAAGAGDTVAPTLHRIEKSMVIKEVTAAGFKLAAESQALHNTTDDHSKLVYDASMHFKTDQFILKFVKP